MGRAEGCLAWGSELKHSPGGRALPALLGLLLAGGGLVPQHPQLGLLAPPILLEPHSLRLALPQLLLHALQAALGQQCPLLLLRPRRSCIGTVAQVCARSAISSLPHVALSQLGCAAGGGRHPSRQQGKIGNT